jgi:FtsP/CotA-like multicopper oxidase with cupredoxin domain
MSLNRRDLLKTGVFAGAAVALPTARLAGVGAASAARMPSTSLPKPFTIPFSKPPVAVPYRQDATTDYYKMSMQAVQAEILPGFSTMVFGYNGSVPGPTIVATQGRQVVVRHMNNLPAVHPTLGYQPWTSVHLHGSASLPQYDGYASDITKPGEYKDYHYPNFQKARTLWYHDHGVHHTAENAYHGLVAQYHMYDPEERALPLPKGEYDVPLIVGDAMFKSDGNLLFSLADQSGHWGDVILVNGKPWPVMKVKRRKYRFRVLTAAISRSFKFSLSSGHSYQVIATDGGLMPAPMTINSHRQLSGERYEIVIDFAKVFSGLKAGSRVTLNNASPKNNVNYTNTDKVMAFEVSDDAFDATNNEVPPVLSATNDVMNLQESQAVASRTLRLERQNGAWTVNGTTWDKIVKSGYKYAEGRPVEGTVEKWTIVNSSGGWFHPLHIHLVDFKVLRRNGKPAMAHEMGPKDVVYTGENETIELLMRFDGCGYYMVHCHNLVHEDHDMMTQFEVVSPDHPGDDPIASARAKNISLEAFDVL